MSHQNDYNPKLIFNVKDVEVAQTRSTPPRTFVIVSGEARTNATSPRLVRCALPSTLETLLLDFEADDGPLEVITKVTAVHEIKEPHAFRQVTVHATTNSISRDLSPGEKAK